MASINPSQQFAYLRSSKLAAYLGGVLLLIIGLVVLFWPDSTIKVVAILVGIGLAIAGIAHIVEALGSREKGSYWGLLLARGIIDLAIGLVAIFWPSITVWALVVLVGIELLVAGIISIYLSFQVAKEQGRSGYQIRGGLSIVFGLAVLAWPDATVAVLAFLIAAYFILAGALLLWIGYQLGKAEHDAAAA